MNEYSGPIFNFTRLGFSESRALDYDISISMLEYQRVIHISSREILKNPKDYESYFFRSLALYKTGKFEDAIKDAKLSLNLTIPDLYEKQGDAYCLGKRFDIAIICFVIAKKINDKYETIIKLGKAFQALQNYSAAMFCYDEVIEKHSNNFIGYLYRGEIQWILGNRFEAIKDLETSIIVNPKISILYSKLSQYNYNTNNKIPDAILLLQMALKIQPNNSSYFYQLAQHYNNWNIFNSIEKDFNFKNIISEELLDYCNENAYKNRIKISQAYYCKAFSNLPWGFVPEINDEGEILVSIFVGDPIYLFDILKTKHLYFANVDSFSDKTSDCPLFHPRTQTDIVLNLSKKNLLIRCCSSLYQKQDICDSPTMWDRYSKGHTGICYTLRIPNKWLKKNKIYANQIIYSVNDILLTAESPQQVITEGLFTKNIGYQDEKEFRLISFGNYDEIVGKKISFHGSSKDEQISIDAIYLGAYMNEGQKEELKKIIDYNSDKINCFQMISQNGKLEAIRISAN